MSNFKALPPIERKPDGSLPRMTPKQRQAAIQLIRNICCNYDDGNCILLYKGDGSTPAASDDSTVMFSAP